MFTSGRVESQWVFRDLPNTLIYASRDILELGKPVLFVGRDRCDGAWQFFFRQAVQDHDLRIAALDEIVQREPTVVELADLPRGWIAVRDSAEEPWQRLPIAPDS
jgi:hypothetical protein